MLIDDNPMYAYDCASAGMQVLLFNWDLAYPWSQQPDECVSTPDSAIAPPESGNCGLLAQCVLDSGERASVFPRNGELCVESVCCRVWRLLQHEP